MRLFTGAQRAFTLIEVMIVLAIMAGVAALSAPYLSNRNSQKKSFFREFTVLSRELHTRAKLQGTTYRLVLDLKEGANDKDRQSFYWVEKGSSHTVLRPNEEALDRDRADDNKSLSDEEKKALASEFAPDTSLIKEPKRIPGGIFIEKVELARLDQPLFTGKAYIHFLPEGLTDEAAIQLTSAKGEHWTVSIHPLTGKAELLSRPSSLKELQSQ